VRLTAFECPNCGASDMVPGPDERLLCLYCGTSFGEIQRVCLECGHYNDVGVRHCAQCSAPLIRDCPACGADNWVQAEHCVECGRNLDVIGNMARRLQQTTQERLAQQQTGMAALKEREERASQERMAVFLEMERERQEGLARAAALQAQRDRQLLILLGVGLVAVVFVLVAAYLIGMAMRGG